MTQKFRKWVLAFTMESSKRIKPFGSVLTVACLALWAAAIMSCNRIPELGRAGEQLLSMESDGFLELPLDSVTTQNAMYMQVCDSTGLAFLNIPTFDLEFYDLATRQFVGRVDLSIDGPNATPGIESFYCQNKDSIWLYASWGKRIYLIDSQGTLKTYRDIPLDSDSKFSANPYPQTLTPYIVKNGKHYLQGMNGPNTDVLRPAASVVYDWEQDSTIVGNVYPECYGEYKDLAANWNAFAYRQTSCVVSTAGEIVTNFPASDSIYVYNHYTNMRKSYFAGLTEKIEIKPHKISSQDDMFVNYISQYQYSGILHDPFRSLYYRIVLLPFKDYDMNNLRNDCRKKPVTVVMLDEKFNKIGETRLPENLYIPGNAIVTPEGLCIQVHSEDDDFMKFAIFKPTKI